MNSARIDSEGTVETGKTLVSIVTTFLNAADFLPEAIASVIAQSCPNWELLLVDDGSTDASTRIAVDAARRFPGRIRLLSHPGHRNLGTSTSRNLGIAHATGNLVTFLDADDVFLPRKLEEQVDLLRQHPEAGAVVGATRYWYGWTGHPVDRDRDVIIGSRAFASGTVVRPPDYLTRILRRETAVPCMTAVLVKREVALRLGAFEDAFRDQYDDQVFFSKLFLDSPVVVTETCGELYRQHDRSNCAVAFETGEDLRAREKFLAWLRGYLSSGGRHFPDLIEALEWADAEDVSVRVAGTTATRRQRVSAASPVDFRAVRSTRPVSRVFGWDRGWPIDRHYIELFLRRHHMAVRGRVLEVGESTYTTRFGGDRVTGSDVLHVDSQAPGVTIVADLNDHNARIPAGAFDCIIFTQTLHLLSDFRAAVRHLHAALRPGGTLLATFPGISQMSTDRWGETWNWAFTTHSARAVFGEAFGEEVEVSSYGNVLAATSFLYGLAVHELRREDLGYLDPSYQLLVAVNATRPADASIDPETVTVVPGDRLAHGELVDRLPGWIELLAGGTGNLSREPDFSHGLWNRGLLEATTEFVAFTWPGEAIDVAALENATRALSRSPAAAFATVQSAAGGPATVRMGRDVYQELLRGRSLGTPGSTVFRRSAFQKREPFDAAFGDFAFHAAQMELARDYPVRVCPGQDERSSEQSLDLTGAVAGAMLQTLIEEHRASSEINAEFERAFSDGVGRWARAARDRSLLSESGFISEEESNSIDLVVDGGGSSLHHSLRQRHDPKTLKLIDVHPSEIEAGTSFNVQPDGTCAIAVTCEGATRRTRIVLDGETLETTYGNENFLTANVPPDLLNGSGRYELFLRGR